MADKAPDLNDFLCFSVYSAGAAFNKLYRPHFDALGLTYAQYIVLATLWEQDGLTVSQIGNRLFLESSTLSPLLKRLEKAGHIRRQRSPEDERAVEVFLTGQGREMGLRAKHIPECVVQASGMDLGELKRLKAEVERLRDAIHRAAAGQRPITARDCAS